MLISFFDVKNYDIESFNNYKDSKIDFLFFETKLTIDTVELVKGSDAVCVFVNDIVDKKVVDKLVEYKVKMILLRCAGFNNVDVKACFNRIHVYRVPAYSPYAVAEHAAALLLTLNRKIHKAYLRTREFNFSLHDLTGFDLHGKTIGIIGTGKIGKCFINICEGFGMNILCYDPYPDPSIKHPYVNIEDIYKNSDIISFHCPLTIDTHHLLNDESLKIMKKGIIIINTSRGGLIDSKSLLKGLKKKIIGGAALDVYEEEGDLFFNDYSFDIIDNDNLSILLSLPNVIITSHQAFLTKEALSNIADETMKNFKNYFINKELNLKNEVCYNCDNKRKEECKKGRKKSCF